MARDDAAQVSAPLFAPLNRTWQIFYLILSFLIVSFGQPAWHFVPSLLAAFVGYALFFRVILVHPTRKARFWIGTAWFMAVQLFQLQWTLSHPFSYIYGVWVLGSFGLGMQFGFLCLFVTPPQLRKITRVAALAGLWTLIEWSRLFFLAGYTFNPIGLALSANLYSLQMASVWGVYGLSFWVMLVNLLATRAWMYHFHWIKTSLCVIAAAAPFVFGAFHLTLHRERLAAHQEKVTDPYHIVLVQTVFPVEEMLDSYATKNMAAYVTDEWKQILSITKQHYGKDVDMLVLPEIVVPFGTWTLVYPYEIVKEAFVISFGADAAEKLPPLVSPFAQWGTVGTGNAGWYVNNAYWAQGLANIFDSDVVVGLEDVEQNADKERVIFSSALHFQPQKATQEMLAQGFLNYPVNRYDKRVLVPMGEYIPFSFLSDLANHYGVFGSFQHGTEAKLFAHPKVPFSVSICYEETFGDLMRECRLTGAKMNINITSDAWFPNSMLPQQHFDHARLRTVESGIPLVRACNTGITSGIDSLGQVVAILGKNSHEQQTKSDSIRFEVPTYTYRTIYSKVGDTLILGVALFMVLLGLRFRDGEY